VITGNAITESRKKYFAFTKPYAEIVFASVCAKNSSPVKTIEDVKHRKIIVQKGSASEELLLKNNIKPAVLVTDNSDALEFLLSNIDDNSLCWVIGYPAAVKIVKENNADDLLNIVRLTDTDMQYAMAVHKDNEILRDILNKALTSLYLDGTFRYLDNTYFGLSLTRDLNQLQRAPCILLLVISTLSYIAFMFITILNKKVKDAVKENKKLYDELDEYLNSILLLASQAIDLRDTYTGFHSYNTAIYAALIAKQLGMNKKEIRKIFEAALLHDIGKIAIPDKILKKSGKLTDEEYEVIKQHPAIGAEMLIRVGGKLKEFSRLVHDHHERYDGKGYPKGIRQTRYDIAIITLADALDAMTSPRVYRKALSYDEVLSEIEKNSGTQFHPVVVKAFIELLKTQFAFKDIKAFIDNAKDIFYKELRDIIPNLEVYIKQ